MRSTATRTSAESWPTGRPRRCLRRRGRLGRHADGRIARAEGGGAQDAHHRARAVDVTVPDHGQRRGASRRRYRRRLLAAASEEGRYDEVRAIDENEGSAIARRAAREEGIFAGTSSGVNLVAAFDARARARTRQSRRHRRGRYRPEVPRRRFVRGGGGGEGGGGRGGREVDQYLRVGGGGGGELQCTVLGFGRLV